MYAIVEMGKKQFKVREKDIIEVPLLESPEGTALTIKEVLLTVKDDAVAVGTPFVAKASVQAKVLGMVKGKKLIVFKKKKRRGYKRKKGHRQKHTRILIEKINF
jgi:large subunit ribosomal protein L21